MPAMPSSIIEEAHPGTTALFMIGCGADQNPYPRSKEELAKYHGRTLALAVEAALQTVPKPLGGPLRVDFEDVPLDFTPPPSREELEKIGAAGRDPARATPAIAQAAQGQGRDPHELSLPGAGRAVRPRSDAGGHRRRDGASITRCD